MLFYLKNCVALNSIRDAKIFYVRQVCGTKVAERYKDADVRDDWDL